MHGPLLLRQTALARICVGLAYLWFYALCDEFHQLFVPGRGAEFTDVCIDSSGALVGIFLIFLFFAARTKLQRKKEQGIG